MTNVVQLHNRSVVVMDTTLETIRLEKNLSAFRYTVTQQVSESELSEISAPAHLVAVDPHAQVTTGLIDDKNLSLLKRGKPWKGRNNLVIMTPALRQRFATTTFSRAWDSGLFKTDLRRDAFQYFKDGGSVDDLVRMQTSDHTLTDRHGNYLPVGLQFDYISNGRFTNLNYDLAKALEILLAREDVDVWAHQGGWNTEKVAEIRENGKRTGEVKLATTVEEGLFKIPYYNAEYGRTHTINFVWKPSVEDYRKVMAKLSEGRGGTMELHKVIFDFDMLGLRAGGAAKYEDYYKDDERSYDSDED